MPTTLTTEVELWNIALDHINERPLSATTDDNAYARFLTRQYALIRDTELRKSNWNFAITYHELTVDGTAPAFRWLYRYALPAGWLRVLPPTQQGYRNAPTLPHEIVGAYLYCDQGTALDLRCVSRVTDVSTFDPLFTTALTTQMAVRMALRFTAKANYLKLAKEAYQEAMGLAIQLDALEGSGEPTDQSAVLTARYVNS